MSKLAALVAIPLGLLALKRLQKEIPDDPTPKKLVPEGFTLGPAGTNMDIAPLFPEGLQLTTRIPGGAAKATGPTVPLGMGTDAVPFFPDTAAGAAAEFAAKKPFEFGVFPKIDLSLIKPGTFTSGIFDPEYQAKLRNLK